MERRSSLRASRSTAGSSSRAGPSTDRISRSSRPSSGGQPLRTDLRGASRSDGPEVITIEDSDNPDEASDSLSELSSPAKTLGAYRKMSTDYKGKGKARDVAPAVFEPGHLSSIAMDDIEAGGASPLTSGLSSAAAGSPAAPSPLDRSTGRGGGIAGRGRRGRGGPVSTLGQTRPRKEPERRVLPARIRRAAGGGAEGIRELEEMIVDWLERYGAFTEAQQLLRVLTELRRAKIVASAFVANIHHVFTHGTGRPARAGSSARRLHQPTSRPTRYPYSLSGPSSRDQHLHRRRRNERSQDPGPSLADGPRRRGRRGRSSRRDVIPESHEPSQAPSRLSRRPGKSPRRPEDTTRLIPPPGARRRV